MMTKTVFRKILYLPLAITYEILTQCRRSFVFGARKGVDSAHNLFHNSWSVKAIVMTLGQWIVDPPISFGVHVN